MAEQIHISVCYATSTYEFLRELTVPAGTTLEQAVRQSGLLEAVPQIDLGACATGIYAKKAPLSATLREHDRVEVYRPLQADPKETRRRRAEHKG
jgi:putative ubiquitin-RnfH superfamily antitoxin RatB of RatAB toxin-antitoxin module